jgi:hypothetical protein
VCSHNQGTIDHGNEGGIGNIAYLCGKRAISFQHFCFG